MNTICQSLYYQYILNPFHFFKSPKTFRVKKGRALCLLTLGHISAYNMDNTILLYNSWAFIRRRKQQIFKNIMEANVYVVHALFNISICF
jgi:hypothetical protein